MLRVYNAIHQSKLKRFSTGNYRRSEQKIPRFSLAYQQRQKIRHAVVTGQPDLGKSGGHFRGIQGDPQITGQRQGQPRASRRAGNRCERRLREFMQQPCDLEPWTQHLRSLFLSRRLASAAASLCKALNIATGTERSASTSKHYTTHAVVCT